MEKMTGMSQQNESYNFLQASSYHKIYKSNVKQCLSLIMAIAVFMPSPGFCEDIDSGSKKSVIEAYELRISGKADMAEKLLTELVQNDSTDALAYFELARTKQHLFLGGTQFSAEKGAEIMSLSQQALKFAPDNEIFAFYYAYSCFFNAFLSMMMQNPDTREKINQTCDAFQAVLNLNPDCHEALLYLVDIYGILPEDMGGDKAKASLLASDLDQKDKVFGAMAHARLMPENADVVSHWENMRKEAGNGAQVLEELGRAYLLKSDTENGTKYFQESIHADNAKRYLYMNLARYHILSTQENPDAKQEHLGEAEKMANSYLQSSPEPIPPLKAHAYGILALIRMISGDNNGSTEYQGMATSIDPYYSKGMGAPPEILYCPPDKVKIHYNSFFMPF
jgi:hypothetical protein